MVVPNMNEGGALWAKAKELYSQGPRFYHSFYHAQEVLDRVDAIEKTIGFMDYQSVRLAALFHDAVYNVGAITNEDESARAMMAAIYDNYEAVWGSDISSQKSGEISDCLDKADILIRSTAHHIRPNRFFTDWDTVLFMDCDVLGFASGEGKFRHDNDNIDKEFATSPLYNPEKYARSRVNFLLKMYKKGIFRSPHMKKLYESKAQSNLKSYLLSLGVDKTLL